ncbi:MAG: DNA repair protein RadA, partial [Patescibacteria group bacterium]
MTSKMQTIFICSKCDAQFPKWSGRCGGCGSWNTLAEQQAKFFAGEKAKPVSPKSLAEVDVALTKRLDCGLPEVNQILGGGEKPGLVPGSLLLLGGDPGIGKSTLA